MPSATTQRIRCLNLRDHHVRAILDGRKTQHRVPVRGVNGHKDTDMDFRAPDYPSGCMEYVELKGNTAYFHIQTAVDDTHGYPVTCPYRVGDLICGREAWALVNADDEELDDWPHRASVPKSPPGLGWQAWHRAGHPWERDSREDRGFCWRSASTMPQWAARVWLEVTGVRIERVNDITQKDAEAEGVESDSVELQDGGPEWSQPAIWADDYVGPYAELWDKDYGPGSWDRGDWVWVLDWKQAERPEVRG